MPGLTTRRTAANLAKEMMPGPRLPTVRPTVSRFTMRRPITVAPRNNRKHTVRVRRTAGNLAKTIRNLPDYIKNVEALEARQMEELENVQAQLRGINSNNRYKSTAGNKGFYNRLRATRKRDLIKSVRFYENLLRKTRVMLDKLKREKGRINTYKVPSLTVRNVDPPNEYSEEEMGQTPNLPGMVEEQNSKNE